MSVETKGAFKSSVTGHDIFNYIKFSIDNNATHDLGSGVMSINERESGNIYFSYKGENRRIFFCVTRDPIYGIDEDSKSLYSHILIGHWGHSVEIVNKIVSNFGGYIMANDSEYIDYLEVAKVGDVEYEKLLNKKNQLKHDLNWNGIVSESEKQKVLNFIITNKDALLNFDWK